MREVRERISILLRSSFYRKVLLWRPGDAVEFSLACGVREGLGGGAEPPRAGCVWRWP